MSEYYTIKQMADMLHVSKQRVYRCIKAKCINEAHRDTVKGNAVMMYDETAFNQIKECFSESEKSHQETDHDTRSDAVYDALLKQLEMKDQQISDLNERLRDAQRALDQEQQLHAMDRQKLTMIDAAKSDSDPDGEEKLSWWRRLFK